MAIHHDPEIALRIDGRPTGKGRPRFDPRSRRAYTDAATQSGEQRIQAAWHAAGRPRLDDGPVAIRVELVVTRPQNHWKTDGTLSAEGNRKPWPVRKPDADNALKLIMDALNGCAYRDDVDVVQAWVIRRWANPGEHDHTLIGVRRMPTLEAAA